MDKKIKYKAISYLIIGDELYKKGIDGVLLKCWGGSKAYIAWAKTQEGTCGSHQAGEKIKWMLFQQGYIGQLFWRIALIMQNHVKNAKNMVPYTLAFLWKED